jgi:hypothetical protein
MKEKFSDIQLEKGERAYIHVDMYLRVMPKTEFPIIILPLPKCRSADEIVSMIDSKLSDSIDTLKGHGLILVSKNVKVQYLKFDGVYCHYAASIDIVVEGDVGFLVGFVIVMSFIIGFLIALYFVVDKFSGFLEKGGGEILKPVIYLGGGVVILFLIFLILREVRR